MKNPLLITCGDPNGIGPEITLMAAECLIDTHSIIIGDINHFKEIAAQHHPALSLIQLNDFKNLPAAQANTLFIYHIPFPKRHAGVADARQAAAIIKAIEIAVDAVSQKKAAAIVTNPISKAVLKAGANFPYPGHTEFLAHLAGGLHPIMMIASAELKVVPVTIHIPLKDVPTALTPELFETTIKITHHELKHKFKLANPHLAVAGLNPHAGENGYIGNEEQSWMNDSVKKLREEGINLSGPHPADALFTKRMRNIYDVAITMYHDQGLIPIKALHFDEGVNVTLGLPFIRTSPDHGTAYDIAGRNIASPSSLIAAIKMARDMANNNNDA